MASLPSRVVLGAGLAAAVACWGPSLASAQPADKPLGPSENDKQVAKQLTKTGIAAQDAGDYDRAIVLYKRAYARAPHPVLLANIALAHRLAGHNDEALTYYERYLAADPNGSEAAPSRVAIKELKDTGASSKSDLDKVPAVTEEPEPEPEAPIRSPAPEPAHPADTAGNPGGSLRITGIVLGGAGIATLALGGYFGLRVRSIEAEAQKTLDTSNGSISEQMLADMYNADGKAAERNQFICFGVGAALRVGGAVTYWLGHRQGRDTPTTAWTPLVGGGFAGIALTGSLR
jgi:tetratricopeptide (TPR) repeat protein